MSDLRTTSPREIAFGLMRGDARESKTGYSAADAALAVQDLKNLEPLAAARLHVYCDGVAAGLAAAVSDRGPNMAWEEADVDFQHGARDGVFVENPEMLLPAEREDTRVPAQRRRASSSTAP